MKIALVRGPSLTRWELQNFDAFPASDTITAFVTASSKPIAGRMRCGVVRLPTWDSRLLTPRPRAVWLLNGITSRLLGFSYAMQGLEQALQGFDILHTLETYNTFSYQAALAKTKFGGKLVVTVWETIAGRGESHPLRTARKRFVMEHADAFLAVTERTRQMLLKEGADDRRIHVIPMGIDLAHFRPQAPDAALLESWRTEPNEWVIVCIARWVREKGIDHLLQAFKQLQKSTPSLKSRLVLVGSGPMGAAWTSWVRREGLQNRVVFAGPQPYERIPAVLASAHCLVLPSIPTRIWEEQFGYVLIEAMAVGCPIISTLSGAIPEVVGDAGLLVPPASPAALAEAILRLAGDDRLRTRLCNKGQERAKECHDSRRIGERLANLYTSVMKKRME